MTTMIASPETERAVPANDDGRIQRVIEQKTHYWQQEGPALNHFRHSGVRPRPAFAPVYRRMLAFIAPGSRVLDVGCGHGRLAIPLAEAGHEVVATDVSRAMLDILEQHKGNLAIEVRQGDAHRLAAGDGEFDVVLSSDFMPHFPDWPRLLREKARVCKVGGVILFAFNFTEHHTFAASFGGQAFDHPYSPDPASPKPFWAECGAEEMIEVARGLGLNLEHLVPLKFLHDSYALGGSLGTAEYRAFQSELYRRIEANAEVGEFFCWLEETAFQRLPFFSSYCSLVVLRKLPQVSAADAAPRAEVQAPAARRQPDRAFLDQVPSEATPAERAYLFDWFANDWDGIGAVVEIGPFLGGTTRAIATGMAANPRVSAGSALHTFDRFDLYYSPERLRTAIEPMVRARVFSSGQADELCRDASFERLFDAIHRPHEYAQRIRLHNSPLPDLPDEIDRSRSLDCLLEAGPLGAVFVDGCKSWASTHYAMRFLLPRLREGAPLIFQDFGWYTCFWISAATHALREFLTPESHVDATYTFRLTRSVSPEDVASRLARRPEDMGDRFFREAAAALFERGRTTQDRRAELISQLHEIAALMTLGQRNTAASILKRIDVPRYAAHADMIRGCLQSPTYLPGGRQLVW